MKVGDLVKWSFEERCYHDAFHHGECLTDSGECGIIIDKNEKYHFVYWINGDLKAQSAASLELLNESR